MSMRFMVQLCAALLLSLAGHAAHAVDVTGAGASLPFPVYAKWAAQYHDDTGHRINYQSIGSGGGQQQIIAGTVDFGASDDPMSAVDLERYELLQFPAIIGGIVPVVNIAGVGPGQLKLTGKVLGDIFLGDIKVWNDPAIQRLNPDVALPAKSIVVVHRSDGSGTTFAWTDYLARVSPAWAQRVGRGKAVKWPAGQGGKGNEGVAAYVRQLENAIGYLEYAYASQNQLSWTQLQNRDGQFVQPTRDTFAAAAENAAWDSTPGMGVVLNDEPGVQSWPVTAASFILVRKTPKRPLQAEHVTKFFDWAFSSGRDIADDLDYVALPATVVELIEQHWATDIRTAAGMALWK